MSKRAKAKQLSKDRLKCNKPKKTPSHKTKSHVVKACKDGKEKIIGQARFLRAYYYFELVKFFGDVPLIVDAIFNYC